MMDVEKSLKDRERINKAKEYSEMQRKKLNKNKDKTKDSVFVMKERDALMDGD